MATIQIIKQSKVEEPTESGLLYSKATKIQESIQSAKRELNKASIDGLKDLLNKVPGNTYNLVDNDIFIASYVDSHDTCSIMVSDVRLESDIIYIDMDNGTTETSSFASTDLLYSIYNSMYVRYICGNL